MDIPALFDGFVRKARQAASDPVLRRWLLGRLLGRYPGAPPFTPHRPPYLNGMLPLRADSPRPPLELGTIEDGPPRRPLRLPLPGRWETVEPGTEAALFRKRFDDTETQLALHRFAWLPLVGDAVEPSSVAGLWRAWSDAHGVPDGSRAWHPYTAAERAINLLDHARRHGLPGIRDETLATLAAHGPAIAARLEFYGDHHTSNHLANDGRGLYLLGLALGLEAAAELGARILVAEAERIFMPSGVLREGSTHYHMLLTRNYLSAWLAARRHRRAEERDLCTIAAGAIGVIPHLTLPGGMPLIGDISPDAPPCHFEGLARPGSKTGWMGLLNEDERARIEDLRASLRSPSPVELARDGWLRVDVGPWAGLWHAAPAGWSTMPGHGHQDCGSFEVHHQGEPLFVDPGRGAYGETGDAAFFRSARAHNTLLVDGADPYPPNKPYYDDRFRAAVGGPPPRLSGDDDGVRLRHLGYARLAGVGPVTRRWTFDPSGMAIADQVEGTARRTLTRMLYTTLPARREGNAVVLSGRTGRFRVTMADTDLDTEPTVRWTAYGESEPATAIEGTVRANLPWSGLVTVDVV